LYRIGWTSGEEDLLCALIRDQRDLFPSHVHLFGIFANNTPGDMDTDKLDYLPRDYQGLIKTKLPYSTDFLSQFQFSSLKQGITHCPSIQPQINSLLDIRRFLYSFYTHSMIQNRQDHILQFLERKPRATRQGWKKRLEHNQGMGWLDWTEREWIQDWMQEFLL
jgi:hypothetical protein